MSIKDLPRIKVKTVVVITAFLLITLAVASIFALADSEQPYTPVLSIYFEVLGFPLAILFKKYFLVCLVIDCVLYAILVERLITLVKQSRKGT